MDLNSQRILKMNNQENDFTIEEIKIQEVYNNIYTCSNRQTPLKKLLDYTSQFIENNLHFYFGEDIPNTNNCKKFFFSKNIYDFIDYYNSLQDKHIYELIKHDRPMKLYFDIDYSYENDDNKDIYRPSDFVDYFEDFFETFVKKELPNYTDMLNYFITDSSVKNNKVSLHIICPNFVFRDYTELKIFMNKVRHYCEREKDDIDPNLLKSIDWCVYSKNRLMRLYKSSKLSDKTRTLEVPPYHTFSWDRKKQLRHFFITLVEERNNFFDIPKQWSKMKTILTKKKQEAIDKILYKSIYDLTENKPELIHTNDELQYLLHLIPEEYSEEYDKWIYMIFLLKKLNVSNEDIHLWSSKSEKYDENSTNDVINRFDSDRISGNINTLKSICKVHKIERYLSKFPVKSDMDISTRGNYGYYWIDFFHDYNEFHFKSFNDLRTNLFPHIPKVVSFIHETNQFIFHNNKEKFVFKKLKDFIFTCWAFNETDSEDEFTFQKLFKKYSNIFPHYSRVVFKPNDFQLNNHEFNLWRGFESKQVDDFNITLIEPILNHIYEVWCNSNNDHFHYILTWISKICKTPYDKTRIGLVIKGNQGCGKGVLIEFMKKYLFGQINSVSCTGINKLTQQFNGTIQGKLFVNVNELSYVQDTYSSTFDKLKPLITDDTILVEPKGFETYEIDNHSNFIFTTNHDFTIKLEKNDRRYACFECNDKYMNNHEYFNNLYEKLNQQLAWDHFFTYMLKYETDVDLRKIPDTEIRRDMIERSMNSVEYFIECLLDPDNDELRQGEIFKFDKKQRKYITNRNLFHNYECFCNMERVNKVFNYQTFIKIVSKRIKQTRKKIDGKNTRIYYVE